MAASMLCSAYAGLFSSSNVLIAFSNICCESSLLVVFLDACNITLAASVNCPALYKQSIYFYWS